MRRLAFVVISIFFALVVLNNCRTAQKTTTVATTSTELTPLESYGQLLYNSQACENCHTLEVENEIFGLISLDGVGGKYSNSWLYHYFYEPRRLFPASTKKSYKELHSKPLNKEFLAKTNKNLSWKNLMNDAETIKKDLESHDIKSENTEILALISYIQQIPASSKRKELDSIIYQQHLDEQKIWDKIMSDSLNIILEVAAEDGNKGKGELLFQTNCSPCHGMFGQGAIGPNLTDEYWLHGSQKSDIARTIIFGVPEKGMISWKSQLTPTEVGELISFISSIKGTNPPNAKAPQGSKE